MKLIDMLVEDGMNGWQWPDGYNSIAQDNADTYGGNIYAYINASNMGDYWSEDNDSGFGLLLFKGYEVAEDAGTSLVTREQYEAALAAKNGGWIEWGGGECPVPTGTLVDVRYRNGEENHHIGAGIFFDDTGSNPDRSAEDWNNDGSPLDIIAYRLHQPQEASEADDEADLNECIGQDVAPVWGGEGLPPVGCECEYQYKVHGSEWCPLECVAVDGRAVFGWSNNTPVALQSNTHNFRFIRSEADKKREAICDAIYGALTKAERQHNRSDEAEAVYDAIAAGKIPGVKLED